MMCIPKVKTGLIVSLWFAGWVMTLPVVPRLADIYGRKRLVSISPICNLLLLCALFACHSFNVMLGISLCFGLLTSIRLTIGYIYIMELFPQRAQNLVGTLWICLDGLIMLVAALYF